MAGVWLPDYRLLGVNKTEGLQRINGCQSKKKQSFTAFSYLSNFCKGKSFCLPQGYSLADYPGLEEVMIKN